jgi:hypothetical protein
MVDTTYVSHAEVDKLKKVAFRGLLHNARSFIQHVSVWKFFATATRLCDPMIILTGCRSRGPGSIAGPTRFSEK